MVTRRCTDGARRLLAGRAVGLLLLGHVGPGSRLKPRPFGEAMADHLGRGRVGSLLDILTQESNAGRSRGVPEPKGRSSAYKHPLLFNVDEEATRKRNDFRRRLWRSVLMASTHGTASRPAATRLMAQGPRPLGPRNQEECVVAQNANAPTLTREPLHDPPAESVTRTRSRLVPLARFLIIFIAGVVATLAWQSWSGAAREAIRGAAREAICPKAAPVAQDAPDKTSTPASSPPRPAPPSVH
jgi:hypothetical protein